MRLEWARHDWVPKWVKCTSLPYLKDILADVRLDAQCLDVRTPIWRSVWRSLSCSGHLDGCVYKHPCERQYGINVHNTTGILSGYRGWKKSCTTKVNGLKLLHGTVRPMDGPLFTPTSMLRGFVVSRLLPKCVLDPPLFRMEEKLHHFGFPNWTAGSTSNIDVGGKGGQHCT